MLKYFAFDESLDIPIYGQIVCYIEEQIKDGRLIYGEKLPSQRDLCAIFKVSRPTIIKALEILEYKDMIKIEEKKRPVVCSDQDKLASSTINWMHYTCTSFSYSLPAPYQKVSYLRSDPNVINLYECTFGKDFFPDKPLKEVIKHVDEDMHKIFHHSSLDIKGMLSLRQAICNHLTKNDIYVKPSQVLVCNNLQNAFKTVFETICNSHSNFYLEKESLFLLDQSAPDALNFQKINMDNEGMIIREIEKHLRIRKKGVMMLDTDHGMPTGITYSMKRRKEIIALSNKYNLPIVESNAVRDCWHTKEPLPTIKSMDLNNNVIYIFSLTRPFMSVPLTAIVASEAIMPALLNVKLLNDEYTDILPQIVLEKLLNKSIYSAYINDVRPLIVERCYQVDELLKKHLGDIAYWEKPTRGVNLRVNFRCNIKHCFSHFLKDRILLYPPEIFGSNENFIWFCYTGVSLDKLDYSLSKIAYHIKKNS